MADITLNDLNIGSAKPESTVAQAAPATPTISAADLNIGGEPVAPSLASAPPKKAEGSSLSLGSIVSDLVEGATAPVVGSYHAVRGVLADPAIHILPVSIQDEELRKSEELGWKGAAFWVSTLAGGGAAGAVGGTLLKGIVAGGSAAAAYQATMDLPRVVKDRTMTLQDAAADVAAFGAFGALTGGAISKLPGVAKFGSKAARGAANKAIDVIPGGRKIRDAVGTWAREAFTNVYDRAFTSGEEYLRKVGLHDIADKLLYARGSAGLIGGEWVATHKKNFAGLNRDEIHKVAAVLTEMGQKRMPQGYSDKVMGVALQERELLRDVGRLMENTGMKVYDPERGLHVFMMRKDFDFPHRFVNPAAFEEGGIARDETIAKVMHQLGLAKPDAAEWADMFALRLRGQLEGAFTGTGPFSGGTGTYMLGRSMNLPGFSEDIDHILPQYYEHVARKLAAHLTFGPGQPVEEAMFRALPKAPAAEPAVNIENVAAVADELARPLEKLTPGQIVYRRQMREEAQLMRKMGVEHRYPHAFAPLERVPDPGMRKVAETIIRRQLGAIETPNSRLFELGQKAMFLEIITKLSLGAVAQPSQILSGVVRTDFRSGILGLHRTLANMPESYDIAMRAASILPSVVRQSEETLTGKYGTEFLSKVGFTGLDTFVRVVNSQQGIAFAEFQARKLASLARKEATPIIRKQMARIEERLLKLNLDPRDLVARGGILNETEMLKAGQKVAGDVSFWGDSLSLPELWKSPSGRFISQFKSFAFQQSKLMKDYVFKPALKGDLGPLARFAILAPSGGYLIGETKRLIRARGPYERSWLEAFMDAIANGAGFGIYYDAFAATKYGTGGVLGFMTGPHIGGTVAKGSFAAGEALRGRPRLLEKWLIETGIPAGTALTAPALLPAAAIATPAISNIAVPPKQGQKRK